jgi:Streptomycin 6-kinase
MFSTYLDLWNLLPDGDVIETPHARLLPVRHGSEAAILKVTAEPTEKAGWGLLQWWDGEGAARVLARDGDAILLERATGSRSLMRMAQGNEDDEATRILCGVTKRLHEPKPVPLPDLVPLDRWFEALEPASEKYGGFFRTSWIITKDLLATQIEITALHGDIHHCNILDFGERGWLAIDPKELIGDRYFDYANIFTNPDLSEATPPVGVRPGIFSRRLDLVVAKAGLERTRLLRWIIAWCGLSAAWFLDDNLPADIDLKVGALALAELECSGSKIPAG